MSEPNNTSPGNNDDNPAVNIIRAKIDAIHRVEYYEPKAATQPKAQQETPKLSKHQRFMDSLGHSGKSLAEIQTAWHNYYQSLPDHEKHEVWQEFYAQNQPKKPTVHSVNSHVMANDQTKAKEATRAPRHVGKSKKPLAKKSIASIKKELTQTVKKQATAKMTARQHMKSLMFGLSMGGLVLIVLLFSFFNERFIAPFITPSKNISSTSIIIDPSSSSVGPETLVIIPKINVEVPVVYDTNSIAEHDIQKALERGVVHYATTPSPGEQGNSVIVGHSSNNIFNSGRYKFAFVLLNKLEIGDTFMLTKNSKRYVYKIYDKKIVKPTDISVLGNAQKPASATLITCDPPGTTINRLVVVGEQISPEPSGNAPSTATASATGTPKIVPGNAPSLWSRFVGWISG